MKSRIMALWMAGLLSACISTRQMTGDNGLISLRFGHQGGATAVPMEYVLTGDRCMHRMEAGEAVCLGKISRRQLKEINTVLHDMQFKGIRLQDFGNITHFIELKTADYEHQVRWTGQSDHKEVEDLYRKLISLVHD